MVMATTISMSVFTGLSLSTYLGFRIGLGTCSRYEPIEDFDAARFKGVWYELQRDSEISFEDGECVTAQYGDTDSEAKIRVTNTQYYPSTGRKDQIEGYAYGSTLRPGNINVYFFADFGADYRVISTDYTSYALIYSCTSLVGGLKVQDSSWVLVRDPIEEGSAEFDAIMAIVEPIYKEKVPEFDKAARMRTT